MTDLAEFRLAWASWEMLGDEGQKDFIQEIKSQVPKGYRLVSEEPHKVETMQGITHWLSAVASWQVVPE